MRYDMKFKNIAQTLLILFVIPAFAANGTMKGDGSAENPFQIEDYEDLKAIGKGSYLYSSNYIVTKDIDASASKNENCSGDICRGFIPIGKVKDVVDSTIFYGTIDGQDHSINNLYIKSADHSSVAFIRSLSGSIRNLKFDYLSVIANSAFYVAGVVANSYGGEIHNIHVFNGNVQGVGNVGGIVGYIESDILPTDISWEKILIKNVSFHGRVEGAKKTGGIAGESYFVFYDSAYVDADIVAKSQKVGGIVGESYDDFIMNSHSDGTITLSYDVAKEVNQVGGIAGLLSSGAIELCYSTMNILDDSTTKENKKSSYEIGGLVGSSKFGNVYGSYATGTIEGTSEVGGLIGYSDLGYVNASYAIGEVKGTKNVGGLVGRNHSVIYACYAANVVEGVENIGGVAGYNEDVDSLWLGPGRNIPSYWDVEVSKVDSSAWGEGLTTKEMKTWSSFVGWDSVRNFVFEPCVNKKCEWRNVLVPEEDCMCQTDKFIKVWMIDEGLSYPYINRDLKPIYYAEINEEYTTKIKNKLNTKSHSFGAKFQGGNIDVRFEIPTASAVKFSLVDMLGRVVRAFDLGRRATGSHFETIDAAEIARGRYVGILQVGGKTVEKTTLNKH